MSLNRLDSGEPDRVDGFWRIVSICVEIQADTRVIEAEQLKQAVEQFESFCMVTQSIRLGIRIQVD